MVAAPETRYAKSGDLSIAYAAYGDGPDLVVAPGFISHLEVAWEEPGLARFYDRLATFRRVIAFDKRGTGLSDPVPHAPTLEENVEDLRAVMDAVGSERADVVGVSEGGAHYVRAGSVAIDASDLWGGTARCDKTTESVRPLCRLAPGSSGSTGAESARAPLFDRAGRGRRLLSSALWGMSQGESPSRLYTVTGTSQELP